MKISKETVLAKINEANALIRKLTVEDADNVRKELALKNGMINRHVAVRDIDKQRAIIKHTEIGGFFVLNEADFAAVKNGKLTFDDALKTHFVRNGYGDTESIVACSKMRYDKNVYK